MAELVGVDKGRYIGYVNSTRKPQIGHKSVERGKLSTRKTGHSIWNRTDALRRFPFTLTNQLSTQTDIKTTVSTFL